ncbi:MAG: hypothetical protein CMF50_03850 [Legionellales bacterium]|nr:hypothetical protein [Legionellales bacterium]|tara:strand:+ start:226 stop:441 length:216 start_codon:yes stop_codon:yes gene_type:complete
MNATTNRFSDKEAKLLDKITKAKQQLVRLKHKQKLDLGELAIKHGLDKYNLDILSDAFARLAEELLHGNSE